MTTLCPTCSRPLYCTNRGSLVCVPCELATTRAKRNGTGRKYTETDAAKLLANRESSRKSMERKRAAAREGA